VGDSERDVSERKAGSRASLSDPARCPVCTQANDCGMARGESTCWCFEAVISPTALDAVPEEALGKICICRRCAGVPSAEPER